MKHTPLLQRVNSLFASTCSEICVCLTFWDRLCWLARKTPPWGPTWTSADAGRTSKAFTFGNEEPDGFLLMLVEPIPSYPSAIQTPHEPLKKSTLGLEIKVTWSGTMRVTNPNEGGWSRVGYPKFLPLIQDPSRTKSPSERSPFREQWRSGRGVPATTIVRLS